MQGTIIRITPLKDGLVTILIKLGDKKYGLTYTGPQFRNYSHWQDLKIGDLIGGLQWKNEKKAIIDADSPVHLA